MPIRGTSAISTSNPSAPNVRVVFQKPRDDNPFPTFGDKKKRDQRQKDLSGLWFLGGLAVAIFFIAKFKTTTISDLSAVSRAVKGKAMASSQHQAYTVGDSVRFRVDENNAERVRAVVHSYLDAAKANPWMADATRVILERAGTDLGADEAIRASALHDFVNNRMAVVPDPDGFERVTSPDELVARWFELDRQGLDPQQVGGDCDDKALTLSALFFHAGIASEVVLFDVNGDDIFDHAAVLATINGQEVYAETVSPGMPLGQAPTILGARTMAV